MNNEGVRYIEQLLIIEDDIGLNQGLSKALKADDRQIISCHDLKAAREQLLCGRVSLILLDINLPDGSGLELLREVKENTPYIPVILLTANDTDLDIVDGLERGADDYITKPFSKPIIVYTALMAFMGPWVDFIFASVILGDVKDKYTVALGLYQMLNQDAINEWFLPFTAGAIIIAIPITLLFIFMQKYYVEGVTGGSVK